MEKLNISSSSPLNAIFVRQPMPEISYSLVEYLKNKQWNEKVILELLQKAKSLSEESIKIIEARRQRLRDLGYEELSDEEKKARLAKNIAMRDWGNNV